MVALIKKLRYLWLFVTMFILSGELCALQVSLSLDSNYESSSIGNKKTFVVPIGQPFAIHVLVTQADRTTNDIEVSGLERVNVLGKSQSMSVSVVNGNVTSDIRHTLTVRIPQEGILDLGPAKVRHNGKVYESNVITLKAVHNSNSQTSGSQQQNQTTSSSGSTQAYCTLTADTQNVVVGQSLVLSTKIYSQGPVAEVALMPPQFDGFLVKEIQKAQTRQENIKDTLWNVIEKKYVVTSLEAGSKKINPMQATLMVPVQQKRRAVGFFDEEFFNNFFGANSLQQKQVSSNDLVVTVNQLPQHDGNVSAVGEFTQFSARLDSNEVSVNEPIVFTLTIEGKGNLDTIIVPKLKLEGPFKYYESKNEIEQDLNTDFVAGKKRFEFIVQVNRAGNFIIPAQTFIYYDTVHTMYKTLTTQPLSLLVTPSSSSNSSHESSSDTVSKNIEEKEPPIDDTVVSSEQKNQKDISFIQEDFDANESKNGLSLWLFFVLLLLPLCYLYGRFLIGTFLKKAQGVSSRFSKNPWVRDEKFLNQMIIKGDVAGLHEFFLQFLSNRYHVKRDVITEDWIEICLMQKHWDTIKIQEFINYLSECARLNFSKHVLKNDEHAAIFKKARYWFLMITQ